MSLRNLFVLGLYWPMLVPLTRNFTASQVIFALTLSSAALFLIVYCRMLRQRDVFHIIAIGIVISVFISLIGLAAGGSIQRSLSDGSRFAFLGVYVAAGYAFALREGRAERIAVNLFLTFIIASVLFSALVYLPQMHPLLDLFKGRMSNDDLPFHFFRFSGFSGFPTDFGAALALGLCLVIADETNRYLSPTKKMALLLSVAIGLAGSASRGAILQTVAIVGFASAFRLLHWVTTLRLARSAAYVLVTAPIVAIAIYLIFAERISTLDLFQYLDVDLDSPDTSVSHRFLEIEGATAVLLNEGFLFGADRDFPLGLPVIEGFWTHLLLRYSWLGLFLGLAIFAYSSWVCFKSKSILGYALGFWFLGFFLAQGFFSDVLFRFKGPFVYGFLFGITLCRYQRVSTNERLHYTLVAHERMESRTVPEKVAP